MDKHSVKGPNITGLLTTQIQQLAGQARLAKLNMK
jgi:hypothetical protein